MIRRILVVSLVLFAGCVYRNKEIPAPKGWGALPDPGVWCLRLAAPPSYGHDGVVAGELVCNPESEWRRRGKYQITLYRDALVGGTVACLYSTVAHEFRHVLQELESGGATRCGRVADPDLLARLEQDAVALASEVAPDCDCSGGP